MLKAVGKILYQVRHCIEKGAFKKLETVKIELKDGSTGDDWRALYKSVCEFLNTNGGIVMLELMKTITKQLMRLKDLSQIVKAS